MVWVGCSPQLVSFLKRCPHLHSWALVRKTKRKRHPRNLPVAPLLMETEVTLWVLLDYLGLSGRLLCSEEIVGKREAGGGGGRGWLLGGGWAGIKGLPGKLDYWARTFTLPPGPSA